MKECLEKERKCKSCLQTKDISCFPVSGHEKIHRVKCDECIEEEKDLCPKGLKKCTVCKQIKNHNAFYLKSNGVFRPNCRDCRNLKRRADRKRNPERIRALDRARHVRRRDHRNSNARKYRQKYQVRALILGAKNRALQKNLAFDLKEENLKIPAICPIFGTPFTYGGKGQQKYQNVSLDRVNPKKGYTMDNVRVISWKANTVKNNGTVEEHQKIIDYIRENDPQYQLEYYI